MILKRVSTSRVILPELWREHPSAILRKTPEVAKAKNMSSFWGFFAQ